MDEGSDNSCKGLETKKPLSFRETMAILVSGHIGVRTRKQREEDFRRANGLHIFVSAVIYFGLIVSAIILLVRYLAG